MVAGCRNCKKFMMSLDKEQEILMNIADMAIETFTAESVLLRAIKLNDKNAAKAAIQTEIMPHLFTMLQTV